MMNDDHIKSELSLYLAGGLTESRNRQIEAHAAACEKCRNALTKARAKQARTKREALKKADAMPNLFLTRQGKMAGIDRPGSKAPFVLLGILLLAGGSYWVLRHSTATNGALSSIVKSDSASVETSSAVVSAASPIVTPSVAPVQAQAPAPVEPPKPPVVLQIQQEWKGEESGIKETRLVVVRNGEKWAALWNEMQSKEPRPDINFDQHVILGVFAGERPAGTSINMGRIAEVEGVMKAPYRLALSGMPVASSTTTVPTPLSHPYLLALIPRVEKKIQLMEVSR